MMRGVRYDVRHQICEASDRSKASGRFEVSARLEASDRSMASGKCEVSARCETSDGCEVLIMPCIKCK